MLSFSDFQKVVQLTPLISIDLIVKTDDGRVLLGKRTNRPAQGFWFVPGGRVLKDERLDQAFDRLLTNELGINADQAQVKSLGTYQHFYEDNFSGDQFTTHYIVLAYELRLKTQPDTLPVEQHSEYQWFSENDLLLNDQVHKHTKWYFMPNQHADKAYSNPLI